MAQGADTEPAESRGRARFEPPTLEAISRLFPQLEVLGLLGAGGMGAVYKARQPALDRLVALKVLPSGGGIGSTERFNREARALARLSHPNIVAVHEFGQVESLHFFIMEFVDGANLRQLEKTSRLSPREALQIIPQICDALQYAHDEGVVHRDIKPENVLVDRKGRVKIADFGLAKIADPNPGAARLTVEGQVMGTPHYMAPEQVERPLAVDHRADIYALGVVFYEMLTGDLPLGKFPPPSRKVQVDVRLDDIVLRALENDPERRYQQASEVKSEVQTVAGASAPSTAVPTDSPKTVVAAGFPLVEDRHGRRQVVWREAFRAWAIIFGLLTLAFAFFSAVTGRSLMGWLGIVGWQSLVYRAVIGGALVVFALKHALRPQTLPQPRHPPGQEPAFWWRSRLLRMVLFVAIASLASTWMVFQDIWLATRLADWLGKSEYGRVAVASRIAETGTLAVTLTNGTTVELLALAHGNAEPNQWWRPDGTPLSDTLIDVQGLPEMMGDDRPHTQVAFKVTGAMWAMETATCEFTPAAGISAGGTVSQSGDKVAGGWPMLVAWSHLTNQATLRFGLRFDEWRNIASFTPGQPGRTETWTVSGDPRWTASINHYSDDGTNTLITAILNRETKPWRMRVIAVDKSGREHFYRQANLTPAESTETWTCTFADLTVDRIDRIQVQAQPVHWIEFRNVPLQSAAPLPPTPPHEALARTTDQVAVEDVRTGVWFAELPGGGKVELLAVGEPDAAPTGWWRPGGEPVTNTTFAVRDAGSVFAPAGRPWDLLFRISDLPERTAWFSYDFVNHLNLGGGGEVAQNEQPIAGGQLVRVAWPPDATRATARVGFGLGEWQEISVHYPHDNSAVWNRARGLADLGYVLHDLVDTAEGARATFATGEPNGNWRTRVLAVDAEGIEHPASGSSGTRTKTSSLASLTFAGAKAAAIREIRVQGQPIHWVTFTNLALVPRRPVPPPLKLGYGGVNELVVEELLDLDSGRTGYFPATTEDTRPSAVSANPLVGIGDPIRWVLEQGFDVETGLGTIGLLGVHIVYLSPPEWETLTPVDLRYRLSTQGAMPAELRHPNPALPQTVGFRTKEGSEGLFQLVRLPESHLPTVMRVKRVEVTQTGAHVLHRRSLHATCEELGRQADLSTPEQALAAFAMGLLTARDPASTLAATTLGLPDAEAGTAAFTATPAQATALRSRRIVSVLTYREDLACVMVTGPAGEGSTFVPVVVGRRDGQWRVIPTLSLGLTPSLASAEEKFANRAGLLWSRFEATPTIVPLPPEQDRRIAGEQVAELLRATLVTLAGAGVPAPGKVE